LRGRGPLPGLRPPLRCGDPQRFRASFADHPANSFRFDPFRFSLIRRDLIRHPGAASMSNDPKADPVKAPTTAGTTTPSGIKGVRIFTYPKIIFIMPTLLAALVCGTGMLLTNDKTWDPRYPSPEVVGASTTATTPATAPGVVVTKKEAGKTTSVTPAVDTTKKTTTTTTTATTAPAAKVRRFTSSQNVFGVIFLTVFALNLLIMSIDFPRFTVLALILFFAALVFFLLWLNMYFELLPPLVYLLERLFTVANSGFYFMIAFVIIVNLAIVWVTRYLDFWQVLPNEILHNHGPFSDLERYPTMQLKFDKEIPDILEYALLRSGRLILHIPSQQRAIVLDNVLWIDQKEEALKKVLSRMEVRVTTDQEVNS
jgi:hypothetical protein